MNKSGYKSIPGIILLRMLGLALFLFLLYIVNHLEFFTHNPMNYQIILFLNNNIWLIILMSIAFLLGEIFNALIFPFNLPAPLFNASGSVLLVAFLLRIFGLIDIMLDEKIFQIFNRIAFLIYPLVFMIVLLGGYVSILTRLSKTEPEEIKVKQDTGQDTTLAKITWNDVGDEFKQAVYDLLSLLRQSINKKKEK